MTTATKTERSEGTNVRVINCDVCDGTENVVQGRYSNVCAICIDRAETEAENEIANVQPYEMNRAAFAAETVEVVGEAKKERQAWEAIR